MLQAKILSLATGVPAQANSQQTLYEMMTPFFGADPQAASIFERAGIACRHTVVDAGFYKEKRGTEERNRRYMAEAIPLAARTILGCLDGTGLRPDAVDDLVVVSCTGIDTPGLDLRLAGELGMRPDLRRTCVLGMGCYAALPGLLRAEQAVLPRAGRRALLVAVELCSLHFQPGDPSLENVVATALFADGAAAVLLESAPAGDGGQAQSARYPRLVDSASYCDYTTFDHMAFHLTDHGFAMKLSAYVPQLLAAEVEGFIDRLLLRHGLERAGVRFWAMHPGSRKIVDHVQERLGLRDEQLRFSRGVLRDYGNMSSPTVLFVLDEIQRSGEPQPDDYGILMAFGPGLTMEAALVQW